MTTREGVIKTSNGDTIQAPDFLLDQDVISWPPILSPVEPGERVTFLSSNDLYYRREILTGELYLFAAEGEYPNATPAQVKAWLEEARA